METEFILYFLHFELFGVCLLCSLPLSHWQGGWDWVSANMLKMVKLFQKKTFILTGYCIFNLSQFPTFIQEDKLFGPNNTMRFGNNWLLWAQSYSFHIHFLKIVKIKPIFFSKICNFPRLMEKTAWVEFFFSISAYKKKKNWLYKSGMYICLSIHTLCFQYQQKSV